MTRTRFLSFAIIIALGALLAGCKATNTGSTSEAKASKEKVEVFNKDTNGLALGGYDAVAYFQAGKAERGSSEFVHEWEGAKWQFASKANRELFAEAPWKYAPQFGGYCSWAVGHGYTANGDPEAWKIVGGKLYLNYNQDVKKKWEQDEQTWIEKGDQNWPGLVKNRDEEQ